MKISELVKELNSIKRKHGDLPVSFDTFSVDPDSFDEYGTITPLEVFGVFKIRYEEKRNLTKEVILGNPNGEAAFTDLESL